MTVLVGVAGAVAALVLCAVMVRDVLGSRTVLTPYEQALLVIHRAAGRYARQLGQALLPAFRDMAEIVNDTYQWAVDVGAIQP